MFDDVVVNIENQNKESDLYYQLLCYSYKDVISTQSMLIALTQILLRNNSVSIIALLATLTQTDHCTS